MAEVLTLKEDCSRNDGLGTNRQRHDTLVPDRSQCFQIIACDKRKREGQLVKDDETVPMIRVK